MVEERLSLEILPEFSLIIRIEFAVSCITAIQAGARNPWFREF